MNLQAKDYNLENHIFHINSQHERMKLKGKVKMDISEMYKISQIIELNSEESQEEEKLNLQQSCKGNFN